MESHRKQVDAIWLGVGLILCGLCSCEDRSAEDIQSQKPLEKQEEIAPFTANNLKLFEAKPSGFRLWISRNFGGSGFSGYDLSTFDSAPGTSPLTREEARAIIRELGKTDYAKNAIRWPDGVRLRPNAPDPIHVVYHLSLIFGDVVYAEEVHSKDELKIRIDAITKALDGTDNAKDIRYTFEKYVFSVAD